MIHVIAIITAKPGQRAHILEVFRANLPAVLAEDGCIAYEATIDVPPSSPRHAQFGDDTVVVVERWASPEALAAHAAAPHMKDYVAKTAAWTAHAAVHVLQAA